MTLEQDGEQHQGEPESVALHALLDELLQEHYGNRGEEIRGEAALVQALSSLEDGVTDESPPSASRWVLRIASIAAVAFLAIGIFLTTPASARATAIRVVERIREVGPRTYEVEIERAGPRSPVGRFLLDMDGERSLRVEGLAGRFQGVVLGRDGEQYYLVPPRPRAPAFVSDGPGRLEGLLGEGEHGFEYLLLPSVVAELVDDFDFEWGAGPEGSVTLVAKRRADTKTKPSQITVQCRPDDVVERLTLEFDRPLPPLAPRRVTFVLQGEEQRSPEWFSAERAVEGREVRNRFAKPRGPR